MDYEKEYNHAFEIAKGYWGGVPDGIRMILESMFPQLRKGENEGEKLYANYNCEGVVDNTGWHFGKPMEKEPMDLEKEIEKHIESFGWGKTKHLAEKELINCTARHFYELGRIVK